ncbi:MAG: hybrid sensor histidine kinase/response regulator [Gemmatimonadetes bacterium]|nr:hybrid sensor histidine kinase/response regulator [Gemmatimonadota bacterium]
MREPTPHRTSDATQQSAALGPIGLLASATADEHTLLAAVLGQMPVGVVLAEARSGRMIFGNARLQEMFRRSDPFVEETLAIEWEGFHPDGRALAREEWPLQRVLQTGQPVDNVELEIMRGDGTRGFFRVSAGLVKDGGDQPTHVVVVVDDISAQRDGARALAASEERARFVSRATNDAVWDWDLVTDTLEWNEATSRAYGHDAEEMRAAGMSWWYDHLHPEDRERVIEGIHLVVEQGGTSWTDEYRYRRGDGTYATVFDRGYVVRDREGRGIRMIGSMADLTERVRGEEARAFQARLLDTVEQAVVAVDAEGRITYGNRAAERLYGWTLAEALGRSPSEIGAPTFLDPPPEGLMTHLRNGEGWSGDCVVTRRDGTTIEVFAQQSPVLDANGVLTGIIGVSLDISDRKALEQQLRQAQKMEAVGQLAGGIAHDFNNLLTVIKGHTELLLEQPSMSPVDVQDLEEVKRAASRAAALTRQLLAFSRKQVLQPRPFNLNATVSESRQMLGRLIGEHIRVETELDASLDLVLADPGQVEQVLMNLVLNARDAMPNGGTLTITTSTDDFDDARVQQAPGSLRGRFARLGVSDTGAGMSEAVCARIFEPFFTTKGPTEGTGLGLSTVEGIVRQSGGFILVKTAEGMGARFDVFLPLSSDEFAQRVHASAQGLPVGRETILLVEDEAPVRTLAARLLRRAGYQVVEAANGQEGLRIALAHEGRIDLVLSDAVMPEMSGPAMVKALEDRAFELRVLYMSGYTEDDILRRGQDGTRASFVAKPFTASQLTLAVRRALDE